MIHKLWYICEDGSVCLSLNMLKLSLMSNCFVYQKGGITNRTNMYYTLIDLTDSEKNSLPS